MLLRDRPFVPIGLLPTPVPLPSLQTAFSRRAAIFGPASSTIVQAGSRIVSDSSPWSSGNPRGVAQAQRMPVLARNLGKDHGIMSTLYGFLVMLLIFGCVVFGVSKVASYRFDRKHPHLSRKGLQAAERENRERHDP